VSGIGKSMAIFHILPNKFDWVGRVSVLFALIKLVKADLTICVVETNA
jgi:hypothetical protein